MAAARLSQESIYRIDHYLGKEMVQNILTMRFGNLLFRSIWSYESIASVQITFKARRRPPEYRGP